MKANQVFRLGIQVHGAVVQLGERLTGNQKVGGSNPPVPLFPLGNIRYKHNQMLDYQIETRLALLSGMVYTVIGG